MAPAVGEVLPVDLVERFRAIAAEMMQYSKAAFDDATRTWEQSSA